MSTVELTNKINSLSHEDYDIIVTLVDKFLNLRTTDVIEKNKLNHKTLCAMEEAEEICKKPNSYKKYDSAEELMNEVLNEI